MAETVGSSFCRGFSVSANHKSAPNKWDWVPLFTKGSLGYLSSMYFSTSLVLGEVAGPFPQIENSESRTET